MAYSKDGVAMKKRRVLQHYMEEQSRALVRSILPREWVVRDYVPDYGIDIAVEVFGDIGEGRAATASAEPVGEFFFAQVKSVGKSATRRLGLYPGGNVEKGARVGRDQGDPGCCTEIEVIPFRLDVDWLLTVQALGPGIPVVLFLVTLDTRRLYFLCINDIIDKYILPSGDEFEQRRTKTVYVPIRNWVSGSERSMAPLRFLAKRSKLYAAFNRFAYQESEIRGLVDQVNCAPRPAEGLGLTGMDTLWHFVKTIKRYDFWTTTGMWGAIASAHQEVVELERRLAEFRVSSGACVGRRAEGSGERGPRVAEVAVDAGGGLQAELVWARALATWGLLMGLGKIYEEVCREWFLPTYFGVMTWSSVEGTEDESVADRILRQARSGAVDDERLLPAREAREGRLGRELEKLMGESGWYKLVASRAHAIATGEVAARREAEVAVVREVTAWRCEVERFAPGRLEEFDAGIRRALEHPAEGERSEGR